MKNELKGGSEFVLESKLEETQNKKYEEFININYSSYYDPILRMPDIYIGNSTQNMTNYGHSIQITGVINKISYCLFSIVCNNYPGLNGIPKTIYISRFPSSVIGGHTRIPSTRPSTYHELNHDDITINEFINYWKSSSISNDNECPLFENEHMCYKKQFAPDNLTITSQIWFSGAFIGDTVNLTLCHYGLYDKDFKVFQANTESLAIYCEGKIKYNQNLNTINNDKDETTLYNIERYSKYEDISYKCYISDYPMDQVASDTFLTYKSSINNKYMVYLIKRGDITSKSPWTDMPSTFIPAAGEHIEPGGNLGKQFAKALKEEMGLDESKIKELVEVYKPYKIYVGLYTNMGRDPRYFNYHLLNDRNEVTKTFGIYRRSITIVNMIYIDSINQTIDSFLNPSEQQKIGDTDEINFSKSRFVDIDKVLAMGIDNWMILDHKRILKDIKKKIIQFDSSYIDRSIITKSLMKM